VHSVFKSISNIYNEFVVIQEFATVTTHICWLNWSNLLLHNVSIKQVAKICLTLWLALTWCDVDTIASYMSTTNSKT